MVLKMNVEFFPFLPSPVMEYSTVFRTIRIFTELVEQLKEDTMPLFCDEGVFRIVVDIFLLNQFRNLIPVLDDFHTLKYLQHSIAKYIRGSGLEEPFRHTCIFGVKNVDFVLGDTHNVQSFKGLLVVVNAIEKLK